MTSTAAPAPLRARDLCTSLHEGELLTIEAWDGHSITARFINASVDFHGEHIARITLELEIDLAPRLFATCRLPVTGDYPVELHQGRESE